MRKDPKLSTIKKLFALSGNKCAFSSCDQNLIDKHGNIFAQICHIEAAEQGGERHNQNQTDEERRSFENLVLLCANHHIESNNVEIWTVEKLKSIKSEHEKLFLKNQFQISDEVANKALFFDLLENIKTELDKENVNDANKLLKNVKSIISSLNNEKLSIEYEILECRCLQKLEKIEEAKEKYESLIKRYPGDSRAFLYLAEIYLTDKDFDKNLELLKKAEEIDKDFWLLELEKLVRKNRLEEKFDLGNIDENNFHSDLKIKSNFYRLYALFFEEENNKAKADNFIEKAIHANPDRFSNHLAKLSILEKRLFSDQKVLEKLKQAKELLEEIKKVEDKFFGFGDIGARNRVILNIKKLNALRVLENLPEFEKNSKETFELSISCYFDKQIEQIITIVLQFVSLPEDELNKLLEYIKNSKKEISDELSKVLIFQFNIRGNLLTDGKKFFTEITNKKYSTFIENLENKDYKEILDFLKNDISFAVTIANTLKKFPELRKLIIESLPNDENIQKEKLLLLLNFDEEDFNEAFNILKTLNLSELSYLECKPILQIIQQKNAWDFEVIILQKLIAKEVDEKQKFNLRLQLFNAHFSLKQYPEVIEIGKELLEIDSTKNHLDTKNKEALLVNTILACLERGKVEENSYVEAQKLLEKHNLSQSSFEFKAGIEAEVYLYNNNPQKALDAVIEGVKIKKTFSSQEYAKLFFLLSTKIGNLIDLKLTSLDEVNETLFVKLKNKDQWYFMGDDNELDAIKVSKTNGKYSLLEKKKLGDKIVFESEYSSEKKEDTIEFIFPIEKYILWQVVQNFQKLSKDGDLEGVWMIEVPQKGDSIDPKNILKMMEDMHKKTEPFFEIYLKNNVPLAMLAVNEGGIINAIGRIQAEQKGFINFSNGTMEDFDKQKEVARIIIQNKTPFYLDGTSSLFLSEIGYLEKIYKHIPNIKIPQSVINFLGEINEKFTYTPGQAGHMGYAQGKLNYSSVDKEKRELIKKNIINSVKLLESKSDNIKVISSANKADCFSEKEIPSELCDACILAQNDNLPIMTEDFIYLKMNELQTKKKAPQYFSSLALLRILYEDKRINFNDYLEYFGYLSSYRFRFLSLNPNDIEMAVFGDDKIKTIKPNNIRKFNFPLTLSEEYGVPFQTAFNVVGRFLFKVLTDNTVTADITEKIFIEILETFPTKKNKKELGKMLLRVCLSVIENNKSKFILLPNVQAMNEKFDKLLQATEIYNSEAHILTPDE
ncbi:hypothetical protein L6274_01080 [Candidatus Parcubacteria bacterium]|nr:hypothetical protein [Candidatus Parcubacteria bacterium]